MDTTKNDSIPTTPVDGETVSNLDDNSINDIMSLRVGDLVDILVSDTNYKKKVFIDRKTGNIEKKRCRISGNATNDIYGLGFFISPLGYSKSPFPLFINEYKNSWVAFPVE